MSNSGQTPSSTSATRSAITPATRTQSQTAILERLKSENIRYKTFYPNFSSHNNFLAPRALAKAGFFYFNDGDKVQCAFCLGIIGNWETGDEPESEHRRHMPKCLFMLGLPVGNIASDPLSMSLGTSTPPTSPVRRLSVGGNEPTTLARPFFGGGEDVTGLGRTEIRPNAVPERGYFSNAESIVHRRSLAPQRSIEELGVRSISRPKSAEFTSKSERRKSFDIFKWPSGLRQRPDELAEAGFFYQGKSDLVRCYHCGIGLESWAPDEDDPWIEHSKWKPDCQFLVLAKGADFINTARKTAARKRFAEFKQGPEFRILAGDMGIEVKKIQRLVTKWYLSQRAMPWRVEEILQGLQEDLSETESDLDSNEDMETETGEAPAEGDPTSAGPRGDNRICEGAVGGPPTVKTSSNKKPWIGNEPTPEAVVCKVCLDADVQVVFLPCGHLCACSTCATAVKSCPICRKPIEAFVRTFLS